MNEELFSKYKNMEPMRYYDNPAPKTESAIIKRSSIIDGDLSSQYIGTVKYDGDWAMFIHKEKGVNLIRSRSISKITGEYGDYTAKLPTLVEEMDTWADGTVLLGEICLKGENQTANTIGTILRCLPAKAIERQKTTPVEVHLFDALMVADEEIINKPYVERLEYISMYKLFNLHAVFLPPIVFQDNFGVHADEVINAGGEGLVLQIRSNPYMPGTRTAWKTLKLKQALPHLDLKVLSTLEPKRLYEGDCVNTWEYREGNDLVTKPYFMGWKNGIVVDYNGVKVSVASGLTDDDRAWLATEEAQKMIAVGGLYAEIKAMSENSRASLRHPCLVRLRPSEDI